MAPDSSFLAGQWQAVARGLAAGDLAALTRSARRAYTLALAPTALLGAALGAVGWWLEPRLLPTERSVALGLLGLAVGLAALTLWLTHRQMIQGLSQSAEAAPVSAPAPAARLRQRQQVLLGAAFGLAAAPGIPWLLACASLSWPALALALALVAVVAYWAAWRQLGSWAALAHREAP